MTGQDEGEGKGGRHPGGGDLKKAMLEAVRAVEQREREAQNGQKANEKKSGADDLTTLEGEITESGTLGEPLEKSERSAVEAITESLLKAKHELEQALAQTQEEAKHLRDKWLRAAADLENYKKRAAKEREEMAKFANERLLRDLLPVADDLDRVIASQAQEDPRAASLVEGAKLVRKKFLDQLERHGVTSFSTEGQAFDPNQQEAVQQVHADKPAGTVVEQLQRGYLLSGRLLRPALVTVSLGPKSDAAREQKKDLKDE